jgi:hypothetical protein
MQNPSGRLTDRRLAMAALVREIEEIAGAERRSMRDAARVALERHWQLAAAAIGTGSRNIGPAVRTIERHFDRERKAYGRLWPDELPPGMSEDEAYHWLRPYIPVGRRRRAWKSGKEASLLLLGEGLPYGVVALLTGNPISTLYRWRPATT